MKLFAFWILLVLICSGCASQKALTHDDFNKAVKSRNYDRAIIIITDIINKQPDRPKLYVERGKIFLDINRYNEAILDINKARSLGYSASDAVIYEAAAYTELLKYDMALEILNKEITKKPSLFLYNALAYTLNRKGDYDTALDYCNKAISVDDKNPGFYYNRGLAYYGKADYEKALDSFKTSIAIDPKYFKSYDGRGDVYLKTGNKDNARDDYKTACNNGLLRSCEKMKK